MPHKCTMCGTVYENGSEAIINGCDCGNRLFFYFRKLSDKEATKLKTEENVEEVDSLKGIIGIRDGEPVIDRGDDIWNIRVKDGIYEIDISSLMMKEPVIVTGEEGRYLVSLSSIFKGLEKKKSSSKKK
ncbi:MAG: Zn-ribbon domain-containing protein [Candidatus Hydrothermarchaeales archaeon]